MTSGQDNNIEQRISKRIYLFSNLEDIIQESVYYRTHSDNFRCPKISILNIEQDDCRVKII